MKTLISRFVKDEAGARAIEYGLIAAGHLHCHHCRRERPRHQAEHDVWQYL